MLPLRSLTSSLLIFSLLATLFHGPLRVAGMTSHDNTDTTDEETGLQFRLSHGVPQPETARG